MSSQFSHLPAELDQLLTHIDPGACSHIMGWLWLTLQCRLILGGMWLFKYATTPVPLITIILALWTLLIPYGTRRNAPCMGRALQRLRACMMHLAYLKVLFAAQRDDQRWQVLHLQPSGMPCTGMGIRSVLGPQVPSQSCTVERNAVQN